MLARFTTNFMQPTNRTFCFAVIIAMGGMVIFGGEVRAQSQIPSFEIQPGAPVPIEIPTGDTGDVDGLEGAPLPENINPTDLKTIDGFSGGFCTEEYCAPGSRRYTIYRQHENIWSYLPGDGDQFGWMDFEDTPYIGRRDSSGWSFGMGLHLLSGPNAVALPPRLWDFVLGYQTRYTFSEVFSCDLGATAGFYSDFEDSARDGVRFPAHAVGMLHVNDAWDWVAGVDYLDRDDYKILPVAGFSWHSPEFPNWTVNMVFPRPRVDFAVGASERFYIGGLLGGGTWDIEMPGDVNDVVTYRDFRLLFGLEHLHPKGRLTGLELGYAFGRQVEFRSGQPGMDFDDGFLIRWVTRR
jgi:hypothetical protein